jgi:glycerol-3-phosphate acyltransferase PlsX
VTQRVTIAVDAMGGYDAPDAAVGAVARLSRSVPRHAPTSFVLVGDESRLADTLLRHGHNPEKISVVHAPDVVGMGESAIDALERKPYASIHRALELVRDGASDAVVSAGHPGAAVVGSFALFERIPGVRRAALASVYPTVRSRGRGDRFSLILDVGATLRAQPADLVTFAVMGSAYSRLVTGQSKPRVALLSNSRESQIGPANVVEAYQKLRDEPGVHFYGNVEGHEIPRGEFDVIVCEGFVGDVVLKLLEGAGETAVELARSAYERNIAWRAGLKLLSNAIDGLKTAVDFEEYGGAPLLGMDQVVILAHPRSGSRALENAIKLAAKNVREDLPGRIARALDERGGRR